jgi:flagellar biogenesis protein FliO
MGLGSPETRHPQHIDLARIRFPVYSTATIIGRFCRSGRFVDVSPGGCMVSRFRILRRGLLGLGCALALTPLLLVAGPPRIIDEEDEPIRPAAFAQADESDAPRLLTPRTKSAEAQSKPLSPAKRKLGQTSLWGTVAGLFAVFGVFVGVRIWLTRHGPVGLRGLPVEALELLGRRTIEPRVSIHIVRCGPKILILGVGPDGVRTLTEITDPVEIDLMAGACRKKDFPRSTADSFPGMMRQSSPAARTGGV